MGDSYKEPVLLPPCFDGEVFRIPIKEKFPGYSLGLLCSYPKVDFEYREIRLLPFQLETGSMIKANYDESTDTVIMTVHPDMKDRFSIGLAANYIEFILSLPIEAR